ncbi:MAG TPA: alanine/glycine:cation symporter family protein [Saprospiraceae bacterium]|nr:alanine/glycine:cation symporter family protein [Saprospiraceae bacterium]
MNEQIDTFLRPVADFLKAFIFFEVNIAGVQFPLIVMWLAVAALFFTVYFGFINVRGFGHAFRLLRGDFSSDKAPGEISHFQALTTALSGTVGIGNIGGVAIVITLGGPGALFWLVVAGFLSMSTKFTECILGVMYRQEHTDGTVSGGPMYYLEHGLKERGLPWLAKPLGVFYAIAIVIGCLGIGNMFQANQAFEQFVFATGFTESAFQDQGLIFGIVIALLVALVILGGLQRIAKVTSRLVPFMGGLYLVVGLIIIGMNYAELPRVFSAIFTNAFAPKAMGGGLIGVLMLGFQRAVFSNEGGLGSAAIAHSAVRTSHPVTEGYVASMGPFIDTVVISSITALVILTTVYEPSMTGEVQGVQLTAKAFGDTLSWSVVPLSIVAILFAYSTIISWSYYGLQGWTYLFGKSRPLQILFKVVFLGFVVLGCTIQLDAVLDISDALVFIVAIPNIIGLYILAPVVRKALKTYQEHIKNY